MRFIIILVVATLFSINSYSNSCSNSLSVREVTSTSHENSIYRAVRGVAEIYSTLEIQRIDRGLTEGDPDRLVKSWDIVEILSDRFFIQVITGMHWSGVDLNFVCLNNDFVKYSCKVNNIMLGTPKVDCIKSDS
jgi:hypothetical protein